MAADRRRRSESPDPAGSSPIDVQAVVSWNPVPPRTVLAGPAVGSEPGPPSARPLVAADVPELDASKVGSGRFPIDRMPPEVLRAGQRAGGLSRGRLFDVRDYGAIGDGAADDWPGIARALDAIRARGGVAPGMPNPPENQAVLYLGVGDFRISRPILLDVDFVRVLGAGRDLTRVIPTDYFPAFLAFRGRQAWRNNPVFAGLTPDFAADHWVDSLGIVDASVTTTRGSHRGFALKSPSNVGPYADTFLTLSAAPPATGRDEQWAETRTLTLEILAVGPGGASPGGEFLCGLGDERTPSPWTLGMYYEPAVSRRVFRFGFRTSGPRFKDDPPRSFIFGDVDSLRGPIRLTVQLDMTAADPHGLCSARVWVQGTERGIVPSWGARLAGETAAEPSFTPGDELRFRANDLANFHVGNGSKYDNTWQNSRPADRGHFDVHGLAMYVDAPYTSDAKGNQVRADGGTIDDAYRYLAKSRRAALIARYRPEVAPWDGGAGPYGRFVRFATGPYAGETSPFALLSFEHGDVVSAPVKGTAIEALSVRTPTHGPESILIGPVQDFTIRDVSAAGGRRGMASLIVGANYYINILGICHLHGTDAWLQGTHLVVRCDGLGADYVHRRAVRLATSDARFGEIRTGQVDKGGVVVELLDFDDYASRYVFDGISCDNEGDPATIVRCAKQTTGTYLRLSDISPGARNPDVPIVDLDDDHPGSGAGGVGFGRVKISNIDVGMGTGVAVRGDWVGEVVDSDRVLARYGGAGMVAAFGAAPRVVSVHALPDVPNDLPEFAGTVWSAGCHRIVRSDVPYTVESPWAVAVCVRSGVCGDPDHPPAWMYVNAGFPTTQEVRDP